LEFTKITGESQIEKPGLVSTRPGKKDAKDERKDQTLQEGWRMGS
jgi:hypothetical protein